MSNMTPLTKQMVRQFVEGFAPVHFPGKSVDEVLDTAKRMTGFSVDFVIEAAFTREQIQKELYLAYLVDSEEVPERDDAYDSDPKRELLAYRHPRHHLLGGTR